MAESYTDPALTAIHELKALNYRSNGRTEFTHLSSRRSYVLEFNSRIFYVNHEARTVTPIPVSSFLTEKLARDIRSADYPIEISKERKSREYEEIYTLVKHKVKDDCMSDPRGFRFEVASRDKLIEALNINISRRQCLMALKSGMRQPQTQFSKLNSRLAAKIAAGAFFPSVSRGESSPLAGHLVGFFSRKESSEEREPRSPSPNLRSISAQA